jgi:hypothetical protein
MSRTSTIELPKQNAVRSEWRRLCHIYDPPDSLRSLCETAVRAPDEGHSWEDCSARRHTICVVCAEFYGPWVGASAV